MILVDSSVWVDHFRQGDAQLETLLITGKVLAHPFIIGELALGTLRRRNMVLGYLRNLPQATNVSEEEALEFIERYSLFGLGIGYVDAHLLASARLSRATLWTRDKRLNAAVVKLGLAR